MSAALCILGSQKGGLDSYTGRLVKDCLSSFRSRITGVEWVHAKEFAVQRFRQALASCV